MVQVYFLCQRFKLLETKCLGLTEAQIKRATASRATSTSACLEAWLRFRGRKAVQLGQQSSGGNKRQIFDFMHVNLRLHLRQITSPGANLVEITPDTKRSVSAPQA